MENVLPPEREEEVEVRNINGMRPRRGVAVVGGPGHGQGDGGAVGGELRELAPAVGGDLGDAVGGGAVCADGHDVGDGCPKLVDHGAAELGLKGESEQDFAPLVAELLDDGAAAGGVEAGAEGVRGQAGRAAGGGEGEAAPDRIEVVALGQDEGEVVAKRRGVGSVEEDCGVVGLAGGKELGTLFG